jgi:hypothetical protein
MVLRCPRDNGQEQPGDNTVRELNPDRPVAVYATFQAGMEHIDTQPEQLPCEGFQRFVYPGIVLLMLALP